MHWQSSLSSRQQADTDDALRAQLASLPAATPSEQSYAALAAQLLESVSFWRARAEAERRRAELTSQAAQQAVIKLREAMQSESETILAGLRSGTGVGSSPSSSASPHSTVLAAQAGGMHTAAAHQHPSHLSRRVSFNRDVVMVVSPEIGQDSGSSAAAAAGACGSSVPRVDEEEEHGASAAASGSGGSGSGSGLGGASASASSNDLRVTKERRLSRTDFNEGAILKQHLPIETLEKEHVPLPKEENGPTAAPKSQA
jgi:hypothetical protein